jgi:hypothetical protein
LVIFTAPNNLVIRCHQLLQRSKIERRRPNCHRDRRPVGGRDRHKLATDPFNENHTAVTDISSVNDTEQRQGLIE